MHTAIATPLHSQGFLELRTAFNSLKRPYGPGEIVRFNLLYSRIYNRLDEHEKRCAQEFVDALVYDVEHSDVLR